MLGAEEALMYRWWGPGAAPLIVAAACVVLLFGLGGCSSGADSNRSGAGGDDGGSTDPALLEAAEWRAVEIAGAPVFEDADAPDVTAVFAAGTLSGSGGVNRYTATYEAAADGTIEISKPAATLMAGPPDVMEREAAYFDALGRAAAFSVTEEWLVLRDGQGGELVRLEVVAPVALEGTTWEALAYNNGEQALVSLVEGSEITAVFGDDGSLIGSSSVNRYTTTYSTSGETITIDAAIATTRKAGPERLMRQEAAYLAALPKTATWTIEGDELWLRDADGAAQAHYIAAPE